MSSPLPVATTATAAPSMEWSIEKILNEYGKKLKAGESISFQLVKGKTICSLDPLLARRVGGNNNNNNNASTTTANNNNNKKKNGMWLEFPRMAKFSETVCKPDFENGLKDGRLYEEDIPKAKDDSDEEDDEDGTANADGSTSIRKKRKRWRRQRDGPKQHWVLQPRNEFAEKWRIRQAKRKLPPASAAQLETDFQSKLSERYHGTPENNSSSYVFFSLPPNPNVQEEKAHLHQQLQQIRANSPASTNSTNSTSTTKDVRVKSDLMVTPIFGFQNFTQPAKFATLSMNDAQNAIDNQRANMTRYMMHANSLAKKNKTAPDIKTAATSNSSNKTAGNLGSTGKLTQAKARLLGKLTKASSTATGANTANDDDDDIMADLTFTDPSSRKGRTVTARKELLSSLGDDGITVDHDGVLGGANDAEFGGKRRFGRLAKPRNHSNNNNSNSDANGNNKNRNKSQSNETSSSNMGNDGMAMEEDFYQRDVQAEYEDLDFDANEQFDDDDLDVGADEIVNDQLNSGFGVPDVDDDDFDTDDEDDDEENDIIDTQTLAVLTNNPNNANNNNLDSTTNTATTSTNGNNASTSNIGTGGFGSKKGLNLMLAKARGESIPDLAAIAAAQKAAAQKAMLAAKNNKYNNNDADSLLLDNPTTSSNNNNNSNASNNKSEENKNDNNSKSVTNTGEAKSTLSSTPLTGVEVDEHGQRLISLEAVRREIWLHHGSIRMKRLLKIFDIKKKTSPERQSEFRRVVRELCIMTQDKVEGNLLVLKQHYSNMG